MIWKNGGGGKFELISYVENILYLVGKNLVKGIAVVSEGHSAVRSHVVDVNVLVNVHNKLS